MLISYRDYKFHNRKIVYFIFKLSVYELISPFTNHTWKLTLNNMRSHFVIVCVQDKINILRIGTLFHECVHILETVSSIYLLLAFF